MKLHYFNQPARDLDDDKLLTAIQAGQVPPGCLLGGSVVEKHVRAGSKPCAGCNGPRDRCGGSPKVKESEAAYAAERSRLYGVFTGETGILARLLRRKP